ncbi:MAG: aldehyde dehydrogenase family protein [Amaricoccus sp.]
MQMLLDRWTAASDGKTRPVINPATGEVVDTVPEATVADVTRAIDLAIEGQRVPGQAHDARTRSASSARPRR